MSRARTKYLFYYFFLQHTREKKQEARSKMSSKQPAAPTVIHDPNEVFDLEGSDGDTSDDSSSSDEEDDGVETISDVNEAFSFGVVTEEKQQETKSAAPPSSAEEMRRQASVNVINATHDEKTLQLRQDFENQLAELRAAHVADMAGTVRPEVVAKTLRDHDAERERLGQLHEKSEEEHTRQLSNMRHVESVAILIKEHDAKAEEHERKLIDQNERSLALEKQTTRELSKNFEKSKNDVERLDTELEQLRQAQGQSGDQYAAVSLQLQQAQQERDNTQGELAQQLKREQTAHQQTLVRQEEIVDELKKEQERRETREKEIASIQAALEQERQEKAMTEQEKIALETKRQQLVGESNEKSTKITELQMQLTDVAAAKQVALETLEQEAATESAKLRAKIEKEQSSALTNQTTMLHLQEQLSEQLENERAARAAIERETDVVKKERDLKEMEREKLLQRLRTAQENPSEQKNRQAVQEKLIKILENEKINFQKKSIIILEESMPCVTKIANILIKHPSIQIRVEGHVEISEKTRSKLTDKQRIHFLTLSQQRAQAVVDKMGTEHGVMIERMDSIGFGGDRPLPNGQMSRRVEIKVVGLPQNDQDELEWRMELVFKESERLKAERERTRTQMDADADTRKTLSLHLAAEEERRQETEDKLSSLQHIHATTEEEAAKHLMLEQQLVTDLTLAKNQIETLQSKLQKELDNEIARSNNNMKAYEMNVQKKEQEHRQEMEQLLARARAEAVQGMVKEESVTELAAKHKEALALVCVFFFLFFSVSLYTLLRGEKIKIVDVFFFYS